MSSDNFSFSFSLPAQPKPQAPSTRYIARPFEAKAVGQETLILAAGADATVRAPLFYAQMLAHCGSFRSLDAHADAVIKDFGLPPDQRPAVRQGLAGLVERDLLQDEATVFAGLSAHETVADTEHSRLHTLCIRTCNRPRDLAELLSSLQRHIEDTTLERVLVLNDAREEADIEATAAVVAEAGVGRQIELIHIDRRRRASLVDTMAAAAGVDPASLHWLIEGDDDDRSASYGANLNLALLLTAGERFLMIDDDAALDPYSLNAPGQGLSLRVAHDFAVQFPDPDRPETEQYQPLAINPILAHERVLGTPVARLAQNHGLQDGHLLADLSPQMIHDFSLRPRVRLTTNGTLGDSGTGSMLWQYTLPADQLAPWTASEEAYRRLAFSRRVARSTSETQIASSVSLMTTTLTGVDNRELLLPVPAKGRGEDLIFGIGIRFLYPGTPCCAFPWMLPHRLHSRRRCEDKDVEQRQGAGLTGFVGSAMEDFADTTLPQDPFARSEALSEWLQSLGGMETTELTEQLRRHLLHKRGDMAARVQGTRDSLAAQHPAPWLMKDLSAIIERHLALNSDDTPALTTLCPRIRHFAARYGETLPTWIQTWRWAAGTDLLKSGQ